MQSFKILILSIINIIDIEIIQCIKKQVKILNMKVLLFYSICTKFKLNTYTLVIEFFQLTFKVYCASLKVFKKYCIWTCNI